MPGVDHTWVTVVLKAGRRLAAAGRRLASVGVRSPFQEPVLDFQDVLFFWDGDLSLGWPFLKGLPLIAMNCY